MYKVIDDIHATREKQLGETIMRQVEKYAYLGAIDHLWIDHIDRIDDLREGVRLRAYGQRDPLVEFKNEAYQLFEGLIDKMDEELSHRIFRIGVAQPRPEIPLERARENVDKADMTGLADKNSTAKGVTQSENRNPKTEKQISSGGPDENRVNESANNEMSNQRNTKLGRNDPCWCGSGKKWKKCHYPQTAP
jgi:preprotein translocase subunit SecA